MQQRAQHTRRAHLSAALLKVLAAQLRAGRGRKLADAARQRRLADVHHRHHIALALLKACRGAGFQMEPCTKQATHWQACAGRQLARRGCVRPGTARRRRCRTGGARSASNRVSWTPPAAARCSPLRSSSCQSPAGRQSGSCTGWGPPACATAEASWQPGAGACSHGVPWAGTEAARIRGCEGAPLEHGQLLHVQRLAQRHEHGAQHEHIELQRVAEVYQHEGLGVLAADDVQAGRRHLRAPLSSP